jgi:hypothetical protein
MMGVAYSPGRVIVQISGQLVEGRLNRDATGPSGADCPLNRPVIGASRESRHVKNAPLSMSFVPVPSSRVASAARVVALQRQEKRPPDQHRAAANLFWSSLLPDVVMVGPKR